MPIQFMFSPDGVATGSGATPTAAIGRRGIQPRDDAYTRIRVEDYDGCRWVSSLWTGGFPQLSATFDLTPIAAADFAFGMRVRRHDTYTSTGTWLYIFGISEESTSFNIRYTAGAVVIYRGSILLATVPLGAGQSAYLEIARVSGVVTVYVNGAAIATHAYAGTIGARRLYWSGNVNALMFTDLYIGDSVLGDTEVRLAPSVSAATTGTLVGGMADQAAALDSDTVYSSLEPGQTLTSNVKGSITDNPLSIKAVQVTALARKSGTALLPEKILVTTPAGTGEIEPVIPLGLVFGSQLLVMATDPNDSAAWTKAKVNSLIVGGKG